MTFFSLRPSVGLETYPGHATSLPAGPGSGREGSGREGILPIQLFRVYQRMIAYVLGLMARTHILILSSELLRRVGPRQGRRFATF